jgi:RsiW-degrading membrane proteinase PrsW (M82 family)
MNASLTDRGWLARPATRRPAQTVSRHAWWIVLLVGAALFGGVIGTVVAGRWEFNALIQLGALPTIAIGIAEEIAKLTVPVLLWLATPHRRPVDGLLFGVASGMGFAALETMGYGRRRRAARGLGQRALLGGRSTAASPWRRPTRS